MRTALTRRPHAARVALALAIIYVVWGSTYLAIRIAVETLPPLTMSGIRFLVAGAILYLVASKRRGGARPAAVQWRSAAIVGGALLLGGNGLVVMAESWGVPSGIAALLVGTVPLWMATIAWLFLRERLPAVAIAGLAVGFAGIAVLANPSGGFAFTGSIAVVGAALFWSSGSIYARTAPLPSSPFLATAMEMLAGGALLLIAGGIRGEWGGIDAAAFSMRSLLAMGYLIVFGSLAGFTAYIWALHNTRVSLVSTYAFVNPVIAVILGALIVGESLTGRDVAAGAAIVAAVASIVAAKRPVPTEASPADAPPVSREALSDSDSPRP